MDILQKQSNKAKKKRGNRRNRKKMQPNPKAPSAASDGGEGVCSRKNSGSMKAGGANDAPRPDETASHLLKPSTKPTLLQEPADDPTSAAPVQQITGHAAPKIAGAQAFGPGQDASSAAIELPPCRPLHSCPTPWRPGEKTAPVQLKNSANSTETHHRTILAILNRITDTKMELLLNRSISLILPLNSSNKSFLNKGQTKATSCGESLPLVEQMSNSNRSHPGSGTVVRGTSEERRSKLLKRGMVSEADNRVDGRRVLTDTRGPPAGQLNIKRIRKDFVSMLLEKAQEEEMYTREYSWFLRGLCAAIEVEADCAQLALERVQERWGEAMHLGRELEKKGHLRRKSGKEVLPCDKTQTTGKEKSTQRQYDSDGVREKTEGTVDESRNSRRGRRKGAVLNSVQRNNLLIASEARSDCPEQGLEQGQPFVDSETKSTTTLQSFQGIELGESVGDITEDNALDTRSNNTDNNKTFCDTSFFSEIIPSEAELDSFLKNSSLKKESSQLSCCGAYGDLSRFQTVIRHRALFRELFTQGPSFRELISTEALLRFNVLYGSLRQLYAGHTPWDEDEEMHVRRRLKNHLRLMVLLHLSTLLPLASLELVRNTLAGPLENPAAAAPFAGGLAWAAPNHPPDGGVMPPQPQQNALEGVDDNEQNLLVVANVFHPADGAAQLPQLEHPHVVAAEGLPQQENENNYNNVASNNLNAAVAANNDPSNANLNHIDIFNDANVDNVNNPNNVDVNNLNDNHNNVVNINNVNNLNNNANNNVNINNNGNNIHVNLNNVNNINNLNNVNNINTNGASLLGMSAELLSFYLTTAGHINLRDRVRTDEVCDLLQQTLPYLSSRQTFLVVTVLELQQRGWTEVKAPDRSG